MGMDISTFANGAVKERMDQELQKVLENIADPNTDPKKPRKLTLTITLKSNENRDVADVSIVAKSTLVPAKDIETKIVMGFDSKGRIVGEELKSGIKGQMYITDDGELADDRGNIIDLQKVNQR
jgi:hypothetical protein